MAGIAPEGYVCRRASGPMLVDGKIDEKEWSGAAWTNDFVDIEGAAKPKPIFRTRVKMLWDDENLYIAAEMEEPQVWATLVKHDSVIFNDPDFEVFLDPDGDTHEYGEFEMNALNTTWDLFLPKPYKDGGKPDNAWEITGLKSAVQVQGTLNDPSDKDQGWCVEIAMPWKSLERLRRVQTAPKDGEQWRINFSRVEWQIEVVDGKVVKKPKTPEFNWVWSPQGVIDMHRPEMWGYLRFAKEKGLPGPDPFFIPMQKCLQEVYYAQRDYFKTHNQWALNAKDLGVDIGKFGGLYNLSFSKQVGGGYSCSVDKRFEPTFMRWSINQDGRIAEDPSR